MAARRRMPGEGSLWKRTRTSPDGREYVRWVAQASFGPRGSRTIVRRVRRTKREAKAALDELLGPSQSRQSLGDFLRWWLDETAGPSLAPNTIDGYDAVIASARPLHAIPLADLTEEHIEGWLNRLTAKRHGQEEAKPASPKTRKNALAMLRRALDVAVRRGYLVRNPARHVEMPRVPRIPRLAMTPDLAKAVLDVVKGDRYEAAYALALCGLRLGEVLGLAWEDVDLDAGTVDVRWQIAGSGKRAARVQLKTHGSAAPVALPDFALTRLRAHRKAQLEERLAAGQETDDGLVFVTLRGLAVNGNWLSKRFGDMLVEAKLPRLRFHDLRHAAATLLAQAGVSPRVAQEYLRHAQVTTTLATYTHVARGQTRDAADALGRLLA